MKILIQKIHAMFIATLFIIAKIWKQHKYPSTEEQTKKLLYIYTYTHTYNVYIYYICIHTYTMEYYLAIKKNEILPFARTWMDLEVTMLSEISQRKTNTLLSFTCET